MICVVLSIRAENNSEQGEKTAAHMSNHYAKQKL